MIVDLKDYVDFLCKHKMNGDQFLFCCLVFEERFPLVYKMVNENNGFTREDLNDLEDRGYVKNRNKQGEFYPDMYELTDKFRNEIYGQEYVMWQEFVDTYPKFIFIEGKRVPAQSCDLDLLRKTYFTKIGHSVKKHKEVIELLSYASDHDMISMGIEKWIKGEQWKTVESLKNEQPKEAQRDEREF